MKIKLVRDTFGSTFTKGKLYIDNKFIAYTIEDTDRHIEKTGCKAKVQDTTCIPRGTYKVIIDFSNHFKKDLIHILNVPCFEGVRLHSGNSSKDTEGCIIVGYTDVDHAKDWIGTSRPAVDDIQAKVRGAIGAGHTVTIEIV